MSTCTSEDDYDGDEDDVPIQHKRRRLSHSRVAISRPGDVIVVVGEHEFEEQSRTLSAWSDYFSAALEGGYKESTTRRLVLPEHLTDPNEWQLVKDLTLPFATTKLSESNVWSVLPWFDFLGVPRGMDAVDMVVVELVPEWGFAEKVDFLHKCLQHTLPKATKEALKSIRKSLEGRPGVNTESVLVKLFTLLKSHEVCRQGLYKSLQPFLPGCITNRKEFDENIGNKLLPSVVFANLELKEREVEFKTIGRMVKSATTEDCGIYELKEELELGTRFLVHHLDPSD